MAEFEIKIDQIKSISNNESAISSKVDSLSNQIRSVASNLHLDSSSERRIRQELHSLADGTHKKAESIKCCSEILTSIAACYEQTEQRITEYQSKNQSKTSNPESGIRKILDVDRSIIKYLINPVIVGPGYIKPGEMISNLVSRLVTNYKEKGLSWKLVKTGCAIATSVGAVVSAAAAFGITAGSAGLGLPAASLVTLHSANTLVSSGADFYNIWFGDTEQVGKIDVLKSADKMVFGEKAGNMVYSIASVTSSIASISALRGKIIQAPDLNAALKGAGSELQQGASGIAGLASDVLSGRIGLSAIKAQWSLLNMDLTHLQELSECASILQNVSKTTKTITNAVVAPVFEAMNPGETYNSSIIDLILGKDNSISTAKSTYNDLKDAASVFSKDTYSDLVDAFKADKLQYGI